MKIWGDSKFIRMTDSGTNGEGLKCLRNLRRECTIYKNGLFFFFFFFYVRAYLGINSMKLKQMA